MIKHEKPYPYFKIIILWTSFIIIFTSGIKIYATEFFSIEDKDLIPKNTIVLDKQFFPELVYISSDQSILLFRSSTSQLKQLRIGDVLWLNAALKDNRGFLRQIKYISQEESNDKGLIVQTIPWIANHPPLISGLIVKTTTLQIGEQIDLTCYAADEDKDELFYSWISTGGTILGNGASVTWIAPYQSGNYIINCEVTDRKGGKDIKTIELWVAEDFPQLTYEEKDLIQKYGWGSNRVIRWPDGYVEVYDATNFNRMQEVLDRWNEVIGGKVIFYLSNDPQSPVKLTYNPELKEESLCYHIDTRWSNYQLYAAEIKINPDTSSCGYPQNSYSLYLHSFSGIAGFDVWKGMTIDREDWKNFNLIPEIMQTMIRALYQLPSAYNF